MTCGALSNGDYLSRRKPLPLWFWDLDYIDTGWQSALA